MQQFLFKYASDLIVKGWRGEVMLKISNRLIGKGQPAYIIAEMSANHAGDIENAKKIIRAAKDAGADCIKIQTYTADTLTIDCDNEYFQIKSGTWEGENLYKLYQRAYTPWEWHKEIIEEAKEVGIDIFSTPFDTTAVDFLEDLGMDFYKVASFELVDIPLLRYIAKTGKPMIMSTGMASLEEIEEAVQAVRAEGNEQIALLKCSSAYPAIPTDMNLKTIQDMQERFQIPTGLSDHSMGALGAVTAVALGANIIEKHFCLSREIENADSSFSMEPQEFKEMVEQIRMAERAMGKVHYGPSEQEKGSMVFRRSLFAISDIKKGDVITQSNIKSIRPGYGLKPKYLEAVLGKIANEDITYGSPITFDKIENIKYVFLTNNSNTDNLYKWLEEKEGKENVIKLSEKISLELLEKIEPEYIISYNYQHLISNEIINYMQGRIINLHISFLPYNKGTSPNFFSFITDTPKGVTIHQISEKLDAGKIFCNKEVKMDEGKESFSSSYNRLHEEMQKLFMEKWDEIKSGVLVPKEQTGNGTLHKKKELDYLNELCPIDWDENIQIYKQKLSKCLWENKEKYMR